MKIENWNSDRTIRLPDFALVVDGENNHYITADGNLMARFDDPCHALATVQYLAGLDAMVNERPESMGRLEVFGNVHTQIWVDPEFLAPDMVVEAAESSRVNDGETYWIIDEEGNEIEG